MSDLSVELTRAAMWGNHQLLESLLQNGADPNFANKAGDSPLHEAAYYGEIECASILLKYKADVNRTGNLGKTPLHKAVIGVRGQVPRTKYDTEQRIHDNQMNIVKLLVAAGASLKTSDETGFTPRELAMQCDFYECADLIDELDKLQTEAEQKRIRKEKINRLFSACESGDLEVVKSVLPDIPEAVNDFIHCNENLLMCAARNGQLDIVSYVLDNGAVSVASRKSDKTALHMACEAGHNDVVVCLLSRLPTLLEIDDSPRETSLHFAAKHGHTTIARNLIAVASRAYQLRSSEEHEVVCFYNSDGSKVVISDTAADKNVDVMAKSAFGDHNTALHEAAGKGHVEIVEYIIEHLSQYHKLPKTDSLSSPPRKHGSTPKKALKVVPGIDTRNIRGKTPFHEAAKGIHFSVMKVLLEAGADINATIKFFEGFEDASDLTALNQACLMGEIDVVQFLLNNGATDARLKSLTRTLRIPNNDIAGLILCYNGGVREIPSPVRSHRSPRTPLPSQQPTTVNLDVVWRSKELRYIHPSWLEAVFKLPSLQGRNAVISQLDVSSNKLTEVPIELFQLPNLKILDISRNKISVLPLLETQKNHGWGCCILSQIDANTNNLTTVPNSLFALPELKEINMNDNQIAYVSSSVWTAPKLLKFYLARNALTEFPSERHPSEKIIADDFSPLETLPEDSSSLDYRPARTRLSYSEMSSQSSSISEDKSEPYPVFMPYSNSTILSRKTSEQRDTIQTQVVTSRRQESFQDMNIEVEELEDVDTLGEETPTNFCLQVLDLSSNSLSNVPSGLSCLAPKLQKLNISNNLIKTLGSINDYPFEIELLDASKNLLHSAIAPAPSGSDYRHCLPCARKPFVDVTQTDTVQTFTYKPCAHRAHKNLRKLTTLKLNNNQLYTLDLFKEIGKKSKGNELVASFEDSVIDQKSRSNTTADRTKLLASGATAKSISPVPDMFKMFSQSTAVLKSSAFGKKDTSGKKLSGDSGLDTSKSNGSSHSSGSKDGSGGGGSSRDQSFVISPLFPLLSTLELAHNKLKSVPLHIHHVTNLSCLIISHNTDIDTLPLQLCNCEHLWNLEFEGCPLTNPPVGDLQKYRLAADKLLYMKSLLHNAEPNESMKLMLVGLQKMGKTTLLSRLREVNEEATPYTTYTQRITGEEPPSTPASRKLSIKRKAPLSTVGVDLGIWKYRKDLEPDFLKNKKRGTKSLRTVTFYTWDFGGQEEYYVTHQCFLSVRSLYLVVWDITEGEEGIEQLGPWLHNIQARAPDSPVVIVGTHCDKLKADDRDRKKAQMNDIIYQKFLVGKGSQQLREMGLPKIRDVIYVGCPSVGKLEGVSELRMALYDIAFSLTMPGKGHAAKKKLLEQPIPANFLKLEERVRVLATQCRTDQIPPLLKETVFRDSTKDIIVNPRELNQAVTFLHENGIMLHYDTPALGHLYFVDPQWLCDMLAHIIAVPEVNRFIQRQEGSEVGILRTTVLSQVFKGNVFPQAYRKEYVELLGKFEVALYLDRHRLLVPSMLAPKPKYTLHTFRNVFPRPALLDILALSPDTTALFSPDSSSDLESSTEIKDEAQLAVATLISEELFRTKFLLRRLYFMTYVPSGFWPRLISRFLASNEFGEILLRSLGYDKEHIKEVMEELVSGAQTGAVSIEWSYWKTGIELWYKGLSLLRITEILPGGSFNNCKPSPSIFSQSFSTPVEPAMDASGLSFDLSGHWMPVDMTPNRGIEIIVPDTVCLALLQKEVEALGTLKQECSSGESDVPFCPRYENRWMSAELLALAADYIDTLLEDWYPGLGARDGNKTVESIPYVNRVIPCPFCVSGAVPLREEDQVTWSSLQGKAENGPLSDDSTTSTKNQSTESDESKSRARKSLFKKSQARENSISELAIPLETSAQNSPGTKATRRQRGLTDIGQDEGPEGVREPVSSRLALVGSETGLDVASKFGFMLESCILASRKGGELICPAHKEHPLTVEHLAPDLVFGDLPRNFILDPACFDKGEYVDHGSFGDIFHGSVYPSRTATDDEGREVAIKIDRMDSRKHNAESVTKAYVEVRTEVSILHKVQHPNIIDFIGVVLQPLCFILEWAPNGNLSSLFKKYRKVDARISPMALQATALQVASGLAYLHEHRYVYYDLKSPNILVFQFPTAQESLETSQPLEYPQSTEDYQLPVLVKIADLGISRELSPGGVKGFKGSPGFMAPEILKYVGLEACTEKVDVFSYGMFLFELIALHFPFEKQNLMGTQIEKLVVDGERPPLQNRELNSPILYLDVMRWCWQQDYRQRPSAELLSSVLTNPSIPRLVDAVSLHNSSEITCCCICTLPIEIVPPGEEKGQPPPHPSLARGDLQEELWLCTYTMEGSEITVINFEGKAAQTFPVCSSKITCISAVNFQLWLGNEEGQVLVLDAITKLTLITRQLAVQVHQGIFSIHHISSTSQVVVTRRDGSVILFNEDIKDRKIPDISNFDNRVTGTELPVLSFIKGPEQPIASTILVGANNKHTLWSGTKHEILVLFDITITQTENCRKVSSSSQQRYEIPEENMVCSMVFIGGEYLWGLTSPGERAVLQCWSVSSETRLSVIPVSQLAEPSASSLFSMGTELQLALSNGQILVASTSGTEIINTTLLKGHTKEIYQLLSIGGRVLPRHWLPSIIGRNNVIDFYRDVLNEKDIRGITSTMVGYQTRLLMSIGHGYLGVTDRLVDSIMSHRDRQENFVLLWSVNR